MKGLTNLLCQSFGSQQLKMLCYKRHPWFLAQHIQYVGISHLLQEDWTANEKKEKKLSVWYYIKHVNINGNNNALECI